MTLTADVLYVTPEVSAIYYMDVDLANSALEQLAQEQYMISEEWKEDHFVGTYTTQNDNTTVFTTLPYDDGWKIYIDGNEIEYEKALDALISFEITSAGEHTLEMKYAPKTFTLGLAISILSLMLFVAIVIFEKPLLIIRDKLLIRSTADEEMVDDNNIDDVEEESPNEQVEE
jgi:uncharacterized membrane protein YfhO